jgi:hypothetical protein
MLTLLVCLGLALLFSLALTLLIQGIEREGQEEEN